MAQSGDDHENQEQYSGLNIEKARYQPSRTNTGVALSTEKVKFPIARDRSKGPPYQKRKASAL